MARVTSGGAGKMRRKGQRIARGLEDLSPLLRDIGQGMASNARVRIAKESDPDGKRWPPLAPSTAAGFVRRGRRSKGLRGAVAARLFRATRGKKGKERTAAIGRVAKETGVKKGRLRAATGERRGTGHILVRDGLLLASISWRVTGRNRVQRHFGQIYGVYHQQGRGHNPVRRFFGFGRDDIEMINRAKRRHARRIMGGAA